MTQNVAEKPIVFIKTKRNTYIFNPQYYHNMNSSIRINKKIEVALLETTEIKQKPVTVEVINSVKVEDCFVDKDNVTISPEEFHKELNKLAEGSVYDPNYLFDLKFESLEKEFIYRQYRMRWKAVHKIVKHYNEIPFVIKNEVVSEYPEIVPFAQYGEDFTDVTCRLTIGPKTALNVAIAEYNKEQPNTFVIYSENSKAPDGYRYTISDCSHSGIHYYKINGEYVFNTDGNRFEVAKTHNGSYEECVKVRAEYINRIKTVLEQFIYTKEHKKITENERIELLCQMKHIYSKMVEVESMRKTEKQYYNAKESLRKLIEYVQTKK